MGTRGF